MIGWSWKAMMAMACAGLSAAGTLAGDALSRDFWSADAIEWGDGRPFDTPVKREGPYPQGYKADFQFQIPRTGWYELIFRGGGPRHDLLLDGQFLYHRRTPSKLGQDAKAGNVWLPAGKHTLRIQRVGLMGFPSQLFGTFELRPADGRPETCITAEKTLVDVLRRGEKFAIRVTGGGPDATVYELLSRSSSEPAMPVQVVGEVAFPASSEPQTQTVTVACPAEGAFTLGARIKGGKELLGSEFPIGPYAVVDVARIEPASGKLTPVHEIDCVAQTDNGEAIPPERFVECNGPTRVSRSPAGSYRESHNSTAPLAPAMSRPDDQRCYSGFSYRIELPSVQVPYLIDLEFPDDARRSVTIGQNWLDEQGGFAKGSSYSAKAYETGGMQPLSQAMRHHRAIVWAKSKQLLLAVLSQQYLQRAAVARITVSRFEGDLVPAAKVAAADGRQFCFWYEETTNWRHLVSVESESLADMFEGADRLARLCRYFGFNALSLPAVGYQGSCFRTDRLEGYGIPEYDLIRLTTLFCEKYGMASTPEIFSNQWYLNLVELPRRAERPEDVRAFSCHGAANGQGAAPCNLNPLHPAVQQVWLEALGELADKLRDSPAFKGLTGRVDAWQFRGDFSFPSLNWGYGDWIVRQFEQDAGVKVPGAAGDPQRFIQRFEFLTAKDMQPRWVAWRCQRLLDYHLRLRDRIRGNRHELFFGLVGDFRCDPCYDMPDAISERALGCGVDLGVRRELDGLAIVPTGRYGFRNLGVAAQRTYDDFLSPAYVDAGKCQVRGYSAYMVYQELGRDYPADRLGVKVEPGKSPYYCSAALASGRNSLEKYAVVLAQQDTAFLRDGGNTDVFGDPEQWNPWFAEYGALPALPFASLPGASDPVAVWFREVQGASSFAPGLYFYAVNREQYPVTVTLDLQGAPALLCLGTGATVRPERDALVLDLQPYELRAFRAPSGARLVAAATRVPADRSESAKRRLAFAQNCADALPGIATQDEVAAFRGQLAAAWDAVAAGHWWRVRTALAMAPALSGYEALASLPEGQLVTTFPNLLQERPNEGHWLPRRPVTAAAALASPRNGGLADSTSLNPEWGGTQVLMSSDGQLEIELAVPADGLYALRLGHVAPARGVTVAAIDGQGLPKALVTTAAGEPETSAFPPLPLKGGKARLTLRRDGAFGIYALQLLPQWQPVGNRNWLVLGPFRGYWGLEGRDRNTAALAKGLAEAFIPEDRVDPAGSYNSFDGKLLRWQPKTDSSRGVWSDLVVSMPVRTGSAHSDLNYGLTCILSDHDRTALLCLGVDWWAQAWLNGERLTSNIDPKLRESSGGAEFTSWYPYVAVLKLKKGANTLLVKQHGGSLGSSFAAYISAGPDLKCSVAPVP